MIFESHASGLKDKLSSLTNKIKGVVPVAIPALAQLQSMLQNKLPLCLYSKQKKEHSMHPACARGCSGSVTVMSPVKRNLDRLRTLASCDGYPSSYLIILSISSCQSHCIRIVYSSLYKMVATPFWPVWYVRLGRISLC